MTELPKPLQGEIWGVAFPGDPPGKNPRPVLIVSTKIRNTHPKASTVLVVPFTMTASDVPTHIRLSVGQTGLPEISELCPEDITIVKKEYLRPWAGTKSQPESVIRAIARGVVFALGVQPKDIQ